MSIEELAEIKARLEVADSIAMGMFSGMQVALRHIETTIGKAFAVLGKLPPAGMPEAYAAILVDCGKLGRPAMHRILAVQDPAEVTEPLIGAAKEEMANIFRVMGCNDEQSLHQAIEDNFTPSGNPHPQPGNRPVTGLTIQDMDGLRRNYRNN